MDKLCKGCFYKEFLATDYPCCQCSRILHEITDMYKPEKLDNSEPLIDQEDKR